MPIVRVRRCAATALCAWIACTLGVILIPFSMAQGAEPLSNLDMVRGVTKEAIGKLVANFTVPGRRVEVTIEPFHETGWLVQDVACEALRARGYEVVEGTSLLRPAASSRPDTAKATSSAGGSTSTGSSSTAGSKADSLHAGMPDSTKASPADSMKAGAGAADSLKAAALDSVRAAAKAERMRLATADVDGAASGPAVDAHLEIRVIELGLSYPRVHRKRFFFGERDVERFATAKLHGKVRYVDDPAVRWSGEGEAKAMDRISGSTLARVEGLTYPFTAPTLPKGNASRIIEPIIVSAIVVGLVFLFVSNRS